MTITDQVIRRTAALPDGGRIVAEIRFDDQCRNGHNTFSITGDTFDPKGRHESGGCIHREIAEHFPDLAPLLKWHLCSTDGPLHYEANTLYLAGDRDHAGKRKGEPSRFQTVVRFGSSPISHKLRPGFAAWLQDPDVNLGSLMVLRVDHPRERETFGPRFTFGGYLDRWHECPFDSEREALEWSAAFKGPHEFAREATAWSAGKLRELDAARRAAIWPEATDAELAAEPEALRAKLRERLPALLAEFRRAVESLGLRWDGEGQA